MKYICHKRRMMGDHDSIYSVSSEDDAEVDDQVVKEQSRIFEEMKQLLRSQQAALKQSLQVLQTKAVGSKTTDTKSGGRVQKAKDVNSSASPAQQNKEEDGEKGHRSHSTSGRSKFNIQICPICGAEFDNPATPDALEEHVASHWASPESEQT